MRREGRPGRVVVEVGHGARPVWKTLRRMPLEDQLYLGLDIDSDTWPPKAFLSCVEYRLDAGRRLIEEKRRERGSCFWMKMGDVGRLPLAEGVVDELYMFGVLSDPRISPIAIGNLLEDAAASIRRSGFLVIDNVAPSSSSGPGDVLIDFECGKAVFRSRAGPLSMDELRSHGSIILNGFFEPLPYPSHLTFLRERGLEMRADPEPGGRFSILVRK